MSVLWVGAAPGLRLFAGEELTAWVGLCQVDWSTHGAGANVTLWRGDQVRVLGTNPELDEWMIETFITPMFRSAAIGGVSWRSLTYETANVEIMIDLETGVRARAGDVDMELADPLDRQLIYREAYDLEGTFYRASWVNVSCGRGGITVGGVAVPGLPRMWTDDQGRQRSTAQLAVAETWST